MSLPIPTDKPLEIHKAPNRGPCYLRLPDQRYGPTIATVWLNGDHERTAAILAQAGPLLALAQSLAAVKSREDLDAARRTAVRIIEEIEAGALSHEIGAG